MPLPEKSHVGIPAMQSTRESHATVRSNAPLGGMGRLNKQKQHLIPRNTTSSHDARSLGSPVGISAHGPKGAFPNSNRLQGGAFLHIQETRD